MTNTVLLEEKIAESGLRIGFIAEKCGLSRMGLYKKIKGMSEFTASEISVIKELLKLSAKDIQRIFFDQKVSKTSTDKETESEV